MSTLAFVLTTSCEHSTSWSIMWTTYNFTKESMLKLPSGNHVDDTGNMVEQSVNLVILDTVFLNLHYGDVENSVDAAVQENFLSEKILS
jgi:hypothetical protein